MGIDAAVISMHLFFPAAHVYNCPSLENELHKTVSVTLSLTLLLHIGAGLANNVAVFSSDLALPIVIVI